MKSYILPAALGILAGIAIGIGGTWLMLQGMPDEAGVRAKQPPFDDFFDDQFFSQSADPFAEMERFRERMDRLMGERSPAIEFDDWFSNRFDSARTGVLRTLSSDDRVGFLISRSAGELSDLKVDVTDGYITIKATLSSTGGSAVVRTQLSRKVPLPAGVDPDTMTVTQTEQGTEIRFQRVPG